MKTRVMPFALIAAIVIGPAVRHARPAPKQDAPAQDPLTVRVVTRVPESIEGRREPTTAFFVELLMGAGSTPGGFATFGGCQAEAAVQPVLTTDSTLREELDKIVGNDPALTYSVDDGVVNLLPSQSVPPLLYTQINALDVEGDSISDPFSRLINSPEVAKAKASLGIGKFSGLQLYSVPSALPPLPGHKEAEPKKFTLHLRNVTLLQTLNSLVRAQGRGVWHYAEKVCNGEHWTNIDLALR